MSKESTILLWYFDELNDEILSEREFRLIPVKRLQHLDLVRLWEYGRNGHTSCIILLGCLFFKIGVCLELTKRHLTPSSFLFSPVCDS